MRQLCRLLSDSIGRHLERIIMTNRLAATKVITTHATALHPRGFICATPADLLGLFEADFGVLSIGTESKVLGSPNQFEAEVLDAILEFLHEQQFPTVTSTINIGLDFPDVSDVPEETSGRINWGGNPNRANSANVLEPRASFKVWSETVLGQCKPWAACLEDTPQALMLVYGKFIAVWRERETALKAARFAKLIIKDAEDSQRTPIHSVISYLEGALQETLDAETRDTMSNPASQTLLHAINDLLDITRVDDRESKMGTVVVTEPITSGLVLLKTSIGDISIELWPREAPKACRNFVQLCLEGYYDGVIFHRVVPNFIAQTGDPSGTGNGGECIYDEGTFEDEFNQRLKFSRRGLVAMANQGSRNSNLSQFFFTLDATAELQNRNTIFGRVAGDTLFNVLALNELEIEAGSEKPVYPPTIKSVEVIDNPFEDIVPRITPKERKEQDRAKREMKVERAKQRELAKRKGTKNKGLLSFGDEPEEPILVQAKFKSSHDALDDPRLRKEVIDDRGTSATLPPGMEGPARKRKGDGDEEGRDEKRGKMDVPTKAEASTSKLVAARAAKDKAAPNPNDKLRADIAKVEADLKKMTRQGDSDDEGTKKKPKRTGPSLLQLEREKYMKGGAVTKGKKAKEEIDLTSVLEGFKKRVLEAKDAAPAPEPLTEKAVGWDDDEDEADDEDWLGHTLVFRKDATLDRHTIDEYVSIDPLSKNSATLDELKAKSDNKGRQYPGDKPEGSGRGGGGQSRGGGGQSRGGGGFRDRGRDERERGGGRDDRGGGGGGERRERGNQWGDSDDRAQGRSTTGASWKKDRVSTGDLA
ncbi:hypothetical protein RQP46_005910 [Phenoliferia psychrophenolica]